MTATRSMPERRVRGGRLTPVRRRLLDRLLDQALELPEGDRPEFVQRCCAKAPRLGFWLQRLVLASAAEESTLDQGARHLAASALAARTDLFPRTLVRGTRFGPWRIIARIGAGGMGEVYHAERADGSFQMQVAIKLIRSRKENLARLLEGERQMMARLNHSSIARLIDGGLAEDGRPYLVMEWVDGRTLGEWGQRDDLPAERYLAVFAEVCDAVSFAHRALVIHGDIKPANLAITREGQVKLLDFGVARLLDDDGTPRSPSALTPGFSAPEQVAGGAVSTASDVYSLGALMHWMVFGKPPFEGQARPAPRPAWQSYRRLDDLIAVIDKATARSPEQRYATVNSLRMELERLERGLPVKARPLRPWQRFGLWVGRHKLAAGLWALVIASVLVGLGASLWQARIAAKERDIARHEAAVSLAVKDHLILLFREASSLSGAAGELTARELLDETAEAAGDWLGDDPEAQLEILLAIAEILLSLEDFASAEPLLEDILARHDSQRSPTMSARLYRNMAMVLHRRGDISVGFEMADRAVQLIEAFPGDQRERLSDALQMRARLARDSGDWAASVADLERARKLALAAAAGPRPVMARAEANLAVNYLMGGDFEAAVRHMEAAEALWFALGRRASPDALSNQQNLAVVLDRLGRFEAAEQRFRSAITLREERFGGSGSLGAAKLQFGRALLVRGQRDEAGELIKSAQQLMARFVGAESPDYGSTLIGRGELARFDGELDLAWASFDQAASIFETALGEAHPFTWLARVERAVTRWRMDGSDPGPILDAAIEHLEALGAAGRSFLAQAHCDRAWWHLREGRAAAGLTDAETCQLLRGQLALGGWREHEAEALVLLASAGKGATVDHDALHATLAALEEFMGNGHERLRWLRREVEQI
jgi:eukaryotic-like serine/threonine-protein kinase